jgi:hypothetical protein
VSESVFSVEVATDYEQLITLQQVMALLPVEIDRYARRELRPFVSQRVDQTLRREPPTPFEQAGGPLPYIRWTSRRQYRRVMAKLRAEGNIPYQRSHEYATGWHVTGDYTNGLTSITVWHDPYPGDDGEDVVQFVGGDRQQGFHQDTGWPNANEVLQVLSIDLSERIEAGLPVVVEQALGGTR